MPFPPDKCNKISVFFQVGSASSYSLVEMATTRSHAPKGKTRLRICFQEPKANTGATLNPKFNVTGGRRGHVVS